MSVLEHDRPVGELVHLAVEGGRAEEGPRTGAFHMWSQTIAVVLFLSGSSVVEPDAFSGSWGTRQLLGTSLERDD